MGTPPAAANQTVRVFANVNTVDNWTTALWGFTPDPGAAFPDDTNNNGYVVGINSPGNITVDLGSITVSRVEIDPGAQLNVDSTWFTVSDSSPIFPLANEALINNGTLNVLDNAFITTGFTNLFYADKTLQNNSRINLSATAGGSALLRSEGGMTNELGGEIVMTDVAAGLSSGGNRIDGELDGATKPWLNNDGTIRGAGVIEDYNRTNILGDPGITNTGSIIADGVNPITFVANSNVDNQGVIRATGAGGLLLYNGTFTNTAGGVIELQNSTLQLGSAAQLTGGSVNISGPGASQIIFNANTTSAFDINNTGSASIDNFTFPDPMLTGNINNTGTFSLGRPFNLNGTVNNNVGGTFNVDDANVGILDFDNHADVNITNGATVTIASNHDYLQDAGVTAIGDALGPAILAVSGTGKVKISGGSLVGNGIVNGVIEVSGTGFVAPGFSTGTMQFGDTFVLQGGKIVMEINSPTDFDQLIFGNGAILAGEVQIVLPNGYAPTSDVIPLFVALRGSPIDFSNTTFNVSGNYNLIPDSQPGSFVVIPEPGTLALINLGLIGLLRRRRS